MTKEEYKEKLENNGFETEIKDGVIIVYTDKDIENTKETIKNHLDGYLGSFGVKLKQNKKLEN